MVWPAMAFAILGAFNVLYGLTILGTGSGTGFFMVWFAIAAVFFGLALASQLGLWERLPTVVQRTLIAALGLAFALFIAVEGVIMTQFFSDGEDDLDCIVVLGAQVREDGPSVVLAHRLDTAYDYLVANPRTRCIVAGGQGHNEPWPEAQGMAEYLVARGIDPARIELESTSTSTVENIANSLAFIDPATDRVGVVTNNFHVFRGVHIAQKLGIEHVSGIAAPSNPWYLPNNMLREFLGVCKDFLAGNI